jgi:hypothetical protein
MTRALTVALVTIVALGAGFAIGRVTRGDADPPPGAVAIRLPAVHPDLRAIAPPGALPDLRPGG